MNKKHSQDLKKEGCARVYLLCDTLLTAYALENIYFDFELCKRKSETNKRFWYHICLLVASPHFN